MCLFLSGVCLLLNACASGAVAPGGEASLLSNDELLSQQTLTVTEEIDPAATTTSRADLEIGPQQGKLAPDFSFTDADNQVVSLSDFRGKVIMLNFWATWCGPCKYEMPLIEKMAHDEMRTEQGVVLLTVNSGEAAATVANFMKGQGFTFPVLLDINRNILRDYNVRGIPTTFFIGRDGVINEIKIGAFMDETQLDDVLERILQG